MKSVFNTLVIFIVALLIVGCVGSKSAMKDEALYERLGGKEAITAVVDEFVGNVAADKRINSFFADADIPHLKRMLVDQIC